MKAVFITNIPAPYQIRYCSVLKEYCDVTYIFCNDKNSDRPDHWKIELESNCYLLDQKKKKVFGQERYLNPDIWSVLNKINPDIVIVGGFAIPTNMIAYLWACKKNRKFVVFSEISRNPQNLKHYKKIYKRLDALLLCGQQAIEQFRDVFHDIPMYNYAYPADLERKFEIKRTYDRDHVTFLYASRFVPEFNPLMCVEAFADVAKRYDNISMIMSSTGQLLDACIEKSRDLGLEEKIEFRLHLKEWKDVDELFADSDVLVYPASFAGWGLVVPEAMAAGMPVITTRAVGASDVLDSKYLIEPRLDEVVSAMEYYVTNTDAIERIGKEFRMKAESEGFESKAKQFRKILEEIQSRPH